ncbi:MAG: rhomboid family intramembrane serine protease [Bacteroidota bacterium]|nr:rhomboid family intramembrane serine protease [Bacteroidota bacterium]
MAYDSFGSSVKRGLLAMPIAIRAIIGINTAIFFAQILSSFFGISLIQWFAFVPDPITVVTQPWRLFTYMFTHSLLNPFHFIFNMLWLWWMGRPVEETIGAHSFLSIYFGAGLIGALLDVIVSLLGVPNPVIGASGAVYGVMVAFAMLYPRTPIMLLLLPPLEARYVVTGIIALDVLLLNSGGNVARFVHLGGALGGYGLMKFRQKGGDLSLIPRYFDYLYTTYLSKILSPMFALFNGSGKTKKTGSGVKSSMYSWGSNQTQPNRRRTGTRRGTASNIAGVSDAEILEEVEQSELDTILDKISKSGYNALSKQEKKTLFELSKRKEP